MRYKCTCEYDGRCFYGWQRQPKHRTVQKEIEESLSKLYGSEITIHGASRTDRGVHAKGQVFHFDTQKEIPLDKIIKVMNRHFPDDVRVRSVETADEEFHSRYHTVSKTYEYKFSTTQEYSVMDAHYIYQYGKPVNLDVMRETARCFLGTHDFKAFMASGSSVENTVRTIYDITFDIHEDIVTMKVTGSGFLYNMVRIMMGVYFDVSEGIKNVTDVAIELSNGNRTYFRRTAPACGLYLVETVYE